MVPNPVMFAVAGGVTVASQNADVGPSHLRFDVCGADITQLPTGLAIVMAFDTPVHNAMVLQRDVGLALDVRVTERTMIVSLSRDPFQPPAPWRFTLGIAFEGLPAAGRIAVGNAEARTVHYQATPVTPEGLARATSRCVELLAMHRW
jgi:hypothetical protein